VNTRATEYKTMKSIHSWTRLALVIGLWLSGLVSGYGFCDAAGFGQDSAVSNAAVRGTINQDAEMDTVYYGYRYYNASTGRWLSRDPKAEKGGLNLYGFIHGDAIDMADRDGRDAAVLNFGGFLGHTFLVVTTPSTDLYGNALTPGIRAYHFYSTKQYTGCCCGCGGLLGFFCDSATIWMEPAQNINQLVSKWSKEGSLTVYAYALGTQLDDQILINELDHQTGVHGVYSVVCGIECHQKSWDWFESYIVGGSQITVIDTTQLQFIPQQWWETPMYRDTLKYPAFPN
jgi:RHS repeat-associated protein